MEHLKHREKLLDLLNGLPLNQQREFSTACGTTIGHMRQIAYGNRPCHPKLALKIDVTSRGAVQMDYLCPDLDWALAARIQTARRRKSAHGAEG